MPGTLKRTLLVLCAIGTATAALAPVTVTIAEMNATSHKAIYEDIKRYLARVAVKQVHSRVHSSFVPRVGAVRTMWRKTDRHAEERPEQAEERPEQAEERPEQAEEKRREAQGLDCSLVPTPVLVPPSANAITYPEYVIVNRCAGGCLSFGRGCAANSTMMKRITVRQFPFSQDPSYLEDVDIEQHTSCLCGCLVKASHCSADVHKYDENECRCDCRRGIQSCEYGKRWNHDTCSCACSNVTSCRRGQEFSYASCSCVSVCR